MKEEIETVLARHEQKIHILERDMSVLKEVQTEIRAMNETLVKLATELKHTNEHLVKHEEKIEHISKSPQEHLQQTTTAIIAAVFGAIITALVGTFL